MILNFPNLGYTQNVLTEKQLFPISMEIDKIQNDFNNSPPINNILAGNINREYKLIDCYAYTERMLLPYMKEYQNAFDYYKDNNLKIDTPDSLWVNFQKKYEFNPMHAHIGQLSFVIWIKIPFYNEEEKLSAPGKYSNTFVPGNFQFVYTSTIGTISNHIIPADKSYNNTLIIFPSSFKHQVYPFYSSNEYRISVSGNFSITE